MHGAERNGTERDGEQKQQSIRQTFFHHCVSHRMWEPNSMRPQSTGDRTRRVRWSAGALEHWSTGALEHWSTGVLEYWSTGALEHWSTGALEHWSTGPQLYPHPTQTCGRYISTRISRSLPFQIIAPEAAWSVGIVLSRRRFPRRLRTPWRVCNTADDPDSAAN